jgi:hypothetical protein
MIRCADNRCEIPRIALTNISPRAIDNALLRDPDGSIEVDFGGLLL